MNAMTHVFLADDSAIHLEGIKSILKYETDIAISGEARTCGEVKQQLQKGEAPDILLLDISMEQEYDGLELAEELRICYPSLKIIILSHYKEVRYIIKALRVKACAYIAKDSSPADLVNAIRTVMHGKGIYFGETLSAEMLLKGFGSSANIQKGKPYELGAREIDILRMLSNGYVAKEIAAKLGIQVNTVESYKEHIKNKLGVETIIEAIVFAVKHNLW